MSIRTTITLEEDILELVKQESRERGEPLKKTLNDLLRLAVSLSKANEARQPFKIRPFGTESGPLPGINFDKTSDLLDLIEGPFRR